MSKPTANLMALLKLNEGQLSEQDAAKMRDLIERHPEIRKRWLRLRQAYRVAPIAPQINGHDVLEQDAPQPRIAVPANDEWSEEFVASYLEGKLSDADAKAFEESCWRSPRLLLEVIDSYRFRRQPPRAAGVSPGLTQRLLDMAPVAEVLPDVDAVQESPVPPPVEAPDASSDLANSDRVIAPPIVDPSPPPKAVASLTPPSQPAKSLDLWVVIGLATAICVLVALTAGVSWLAFRDVDGVADGKHGSDKSDTSVAQEDDSDRLREGPIPPIVVTPHENGSDPVFREPDEDGNRDEPQMVDNPSPTDESGSDWPRFPSTGIDPGSTAANDVDEIDFNETTGPGERPWENATTEPLAANLQWQRVEGLLAVRDTIDGSWIGSSSRLIDRAPDTFSTLPDSWATASAGNFGNVTLAADSEAELRQSGDTDKRLMVRLLQGRIAFTSVPHGSLFRMYIGNRWRRVEAIDDDSQFAVEFEGRTPLIYVRRGKIDVEGVELTRGRQLRATAARLQPTDYAGDTKWFDRPERANRMPQRILERLQTSDDLLADLRDLHGSSNATVRRSAIQYGIALYPQDTVYDWLTSSEPGVRRDAMTWLIAGNVRDARVQRVWALLARRTEQPTVVRKLVQWSNLARSGQALPIEEAQTMVQMLNHNELLFRAAASHFLNMAFENRIGYRPDANRIERRRAILQWEQMIRVHYRIQQNAARQSNAANKGQRNN